MKLTDEEQQRGNENFYAACGSKLIEGNDARAGEKFHKQSIDGKLSSRNGIGSLYFGYGKVDKPVKIGFIGTGDEGGVLIGSLNPKYVEVLAIADIRPYNRYRAIHGGKVSARPGLFEIYKQTQHWKTPADAEQHIKVYEDKYEELLDDPDIEAVIIALPLHMHAEATIKALAKGKHVLCEKLMARTVGQAKDMARAAANANKFLVIGHQRHYSLLYANAVELIKRGLLGDIHHIRAQWHRGADSWMVPMPSELRGDNFAKVEFDIKKFKKELAEFDAGTKEDQAREAAVRDRLHVLQLIAKQVADEHVDAAAYGYQNRKRSKDEQGHDLAAHTALEELIRWRLWDRTGGGLMAELGSHQLDAASIFISAMSKDGNEVLPISVRGIGGRNLYPLDRDIDDHVYCQFDFPAPDYDATKRPERRIVVSYSAINGNGYGGYGEEVLGTEGTLLLMRESDPMLFAQKSVGWTTQVSQDKKSKALKLTQVKDKTKDASWRRAYEVGKRGLRGPISRGYTEEIEHWAWCIRNPDTDITPICSPKRALGDAIMALTANLAFARQEVIVFEHDWFDVASDSTPDGSRPSVKLS